MVNRIHIRLYIPKKGKEVTQMLRVTSFLETEGLYENQKSKDFVIYTGVLDLESSIEKKVSVLFTKISSLSIYDSKLSYQVYEFKGKEDTLNQLLFMRRHGGLSND